VLIPQAGPDDIGWDDSGLVNMASSIPVTVSDPTASKPGKMAHRSQTVLSSIAALVHHVSTSDRWRFGRMMISSPGVHLPSLHHLVSDESNCSHYIRASHSSLSLQNPKPPSRYDQMTCDALTEVGKRKKKLDLIPMATRSSCACPPRRHPLVRFVCSHRQTLHIVNKRVARWWQN
jgi:hypothetical protein